MFPRLGALSSLFILFFLLGGNLLWGDTTISYPLVKDYTTESAKQQRLATLEQTLGIAEESQKMGAAYEFVRGYFYENPKTHTWEQALLGAEYIDLRGDDSGAYHLMLMAVYNDAP